MSLITAIMCKNLNKIGCSFVIVYSLVILAMDLFFYSLRCQSSPSIPTLGLLIVVLTQIISIMLLSGLLEYSSLTAINVRLQNKEEKEFLKRAVVGLSILVFFGAALGHQVFLRSDSLAEGRGASSIGDPYLQFFN